MTVKQQKQKMQSRASNAPTKRAERAAKRHGVWDWLENLRGRQLERRSQLESQHRFVSACDKLLEEFECAQLECPNLLDSFMRIRPMDQDTQASKGWVEKHVTSPELAGILSRYIDFSSRYSVYFRRLPQESRFEWRVSDPLGWKFHAEVSHGAVVPADGAPPSDSTEAANFAAPSLQVSSDVQILIDEKKVKYVRIDDTEETTLLSGLESLAYYESGATFFLHASPRPHLWCLVGEDLRKKDWKKLAKVVTDFHRTHYDGARAGRPRDLALATRTKARLSKGGRMKEIAVETNPAVSVKSQQSYISRLKKAQQEREHELHEMREKLRKECGNN